MTRTLDLRRALWVAVVAVVAAAAISLTTIPEARAQDRGPLRNDNTRMCIGIDHGSTAIGAAAKLFPCDGRPNQTYTFLQLGAGVFLVQAAHSAKCLNYAITIPSHSVFQDRCDRNDTQEYFFKTDVNGPFFSLRGKEGCIGISGGAPNSGAVIGLFPCDGKRNQLWRR